MVAYLVLETEASNWLLSTGKCATGLDCAGNAQPQAGRGKTCSLLLSAMKLCDQFSVQGKSLNKNDRDQV